MEMRVRACISVHDILDTQSFVCSTLTSGVFLRVIWHPLGSSNLSLVHTMRSRPVAGSGPELASATLLWPSPTTRTMRCRRGS